MFKHHLDAQLGPDEFQSIVFLIQKGKGEQAGRDKDKDNLTNRQPLSV